MQTETRTLQNTDHQEGKETLQEKVVETRIEVHASRHNTWSLCEQEPSQMCCNLRDKLLFLAALFCARADDPSAVAVPKLKILQLQISVILVLQHSC